MAPRKAPANRTMMKRVTNLKKKAQISARSLAAEEKKLNRTQEICGKKIQKIQNSVIKKNEIFIKKYNAAVNAAATLEYERTASKAVRTVKGKPKGYKTVPVEAVLFPPNAAVIPGIKYNKRGKPLTAAQIAFGERQRAKKGTGKPKYVRKTANKEELLALKRANLARGRAKRSAEAELNRIKKVI
jgi:hypothetical protein